jgi:L-ascorbate metabolism protein UlaG (beta-lactamase superfamily)
MKVIRTILLVATIAIAFAADSAQAQTSNKTAGNGKIEILWLGQSAMRITTVSGKVIMIDPYLTQNPKTPPQYKNLDAVGKLDLILVTHAHGDHLGDGVELAKKNKAPLWGPAGLDQSLQTLGLLPPELAPRMNKGGTITPLGPDIKITMVHAEPGNRQRRNPGWGRAGWVHHRIRERLQTLPHGRHGAVWRHEVHR